MLIPKESNDSFMIVKMGWVRRWIEAVQCKWRKVMGRRWCRGKMKKTWEDEEKEEQEKILKDEKNEKNKRKKGTKSMEL